MRWLAGLSSRQRIWLAAAFLAAVGIVVAGAFLTMGETPVDTAGISVSMSISRIAPRFDVTGKALAKELGLPMDVPKGRPLAQLGVSDGKLTVAVRHLAGHAESGLKYHVYAALTLLALVYLARPGRPDGSEPKQRAAWYPRWPYVGALQELAYSLPVLRKLKRRKVPFVLANTVRAVIFVAVLLVLFGVTGGRRWQVLYHFVNPFNLFNLDIELVTIGATIVLALLLAFAVYRPYCQFICPFGLAGCWSVPASTVCASTAPAAPSAARALGHARWRRPRAAWPASPSRPTASVAAAA